MVLNIADISATNADYVENVYILLLYIKCNGIDFGISSEIFVYAMDVFSMIYTV